MRRKSTEFVSNMISTHYFIIILIIITIIIIMISVIIIISSTFIIIVMNIMIILIAIIPFFKYIMCTMAIIVVIIVGQWRGTLMLSFIWAWTNGWANHLVASDLRRHRAYYDATVMCFCDRRHDQMNQYNSEGRISWNMMKCFTGPFLNEWSCNISTFIIFAFLQRPGEWLVGTLSIGKLFKIHNLWLRPAKSHETCIRNCVN